MKKLRSSFVKSMKEKKLKTDCVDELVLSLVINQHKVDIQVDVYEMPPF